MATTSSTDPKYTTATGYPSTAAPPQPPPPSSYPATAGFAHPYPAPPPPSFTTNTYYYNNSNPTPYYYNNNHSSSSSSINSILFLRRVLILIVAVFLVVGAATFIVWLVLRPRIPQFSVSSFSVSSFNLSSSSNPSLSADFSVDLISSNPNSKMTADYTRVSAAVLYDSYLVAETYLPPLSQSKHNTTTIHARMAAVAEYVDPDVASAIASDRSAGGDVGFNVRVSAIARFRSGAWRTRSNVMTVYCRDVEIKLSNATSVASGTMSGPPRSCRVDI